FVVEIVVHYGVYVSGNHLDVGVGSGYLLDHCRFPTAHPRISLFDLNRNCLEFTAHRIRRYQPSAHLGDVLAPIALPGPAYDSIGINYVLHCLPGTIESKAAAFDNLSPHLAPNGVLFGSIILRADERTPAFA